MDALKDFLKDQGWSLLLRSRRGKGVRYIYAQRMVSKPHRKKIERYIAPMSKLSELTEEIIMKKLTKEVPPEHTKGQ